MVKNNRYSLNYRIFYLSILFIILLWPTVSSHQKPIRQTLSRVFQRSKLLPASSLTFSHLEPILISSVPSFRDMATYQPLYPIFLKKVDAQILNPYDDEYDLQQVVLDKVVVLPVIHAHHAFG